MSMEKNETQQPEKFKVYELDFGDTNLLTENKQDILDWINSDLFSLKDDDELNYQITIKYMTREEIDALPDWQ